MNERRILRDVVESPASESRGVMRPSFLSRERREGGRNKILGPLNTPAQVITHHNKSLFWLVGIGILIIVIILMTSVLAGATVEITPRREIADLDANLNVYKEPKTDNLLKFDVTRVTEEESISLPSSGTKYVERKAGGKLVVYNEYGKEAIRLLANTRFKSSDGKIFRAYGSILIPGNGKTEVSVIADNPGQSYNIDKGDFSLPGLTGGPLFTKVYARSDSAMTGGFKGEVRVISDKDLAQARLTLESALTEKLLSKIRSQITQDKIFLNGVYKVRFSVDEFGTTDTSDESKQKITMTGSMDGIVLDKKALSTILKRRELSSGGDEEVAILNWNELSGTLGHYDNLVDEDEVSIRVTGKAKFLWNFDHESLKLKLAGTPRNKSADVFLNYPGIEKAEIKLSPFWKKTFPDDPEKIEIEVLTE